MRGAFIWDVLRLRLQIHNGKVVIILTGENRKLDYYTIVYLEDFMNRKYANEAIILLNDKKSYEMVKIVAPSVRLKIYRYSKNKIKRLYRYYSFFKFSDRVVFTYTGFPEDNQLGKALRETEINEVDAVCLGLYRLREVPVKKGKK